MPKARIHLARGEKEQQVHNGRKAVVFIRESAQDTTCVRKDARIW
jgi:hypothetical protein